MSTAEPPATTPASDTPPAASSEAPKAVGAGRGLLYITLAKIWFMVGGAALGFVLPYAFRSGSDPGHAKALFGEWGLLLSWVSPLNNVIVTASIQTVAKIAAQGAEYVEGAKRAALRLQTTIGLGIALVYALAAPLIASFERDPGLTPALRLSAGVVVCYAFYAVFVGAANGAREFHKQAALDAGFTTLRALLVIASAVLFGSSLGAVAGFVAAAAVILLIAVRLVGLGTVRTPVSSRELLQFMAPVATYLLIINLLMFTDGWLLKRLVAQAATLPDYPLRGRTPAQVASEALGVYTAVQNISRIPYQAILAVTFVIFPLISQATFAADQTRTRSYIRRSIRLPLLVVLGLATAVAARPQALLYLFPKNEYLGGAPALSVLCFGYVAFSLLTIAGTIINGSGRTKAPLIIGLVTLACDIGLSWAGIRWALQIGRDPLRWAAAGTTVSMGIGAALSLAYLEHELGASLRPITAYRAAFASFIAIILGRVLPLSGLIGSLIAAAAAGLTYLGMLFFSQELTLKELRELLKRNA